MLSTAWLQQEVMAMCMKNYFVEIRLVDMNTERSYKHPLEVEPIELSFAFADCLYLLTFALCTVNH